MLRILYFFILTVLSTVSSNAQLCQGSLGDPIVNITFGSGSNPGAPLPGSVTNYQYYPNDCPNDGYYAVRNSSIACWSNSWHSLSTDHTGDPNGYFMMVNGSFQPSAFYVDTVDLLCSNTTYEFAAWIMNVSRPTGGCNNNPIQPNLTFRIERLDGSLIQSYSTGNLPPQTAAVWKQYGFFFATPVNISRIVLRLINNAPGGCGNDLALDDITFRPCGALINASINGSASPVDLCEGTGGQYTLSSNANGYNNSNVQWQQSNDNGVSWQDITGANASSFIETFSATSAAGTYLYRSTIAEAVNINVLQCRVASNILTIRINANKPTVTTNTGPVCDGQPVLLNATGGTTYSWSGPNGFTGSGPVLTIANINPLGAGKYYVEVTSNGLCKKMDSTILVVRAKPMAVVANNSFTECMGDSVQLQAAGGNAYRWTPSLGLSSATIANPMAVPVQSTLYTVQVSDQYLCTDTAIVQINIKDKPIVSAGSDKVITEGQSVQLNGSVTGGATYVWLPPYNISDVHALQPIVKPATDTLYVLRATSLNGCGTVSDAVRILVYKKLNIPNAFSPNGDGINDVWKIPALEAYPGFELIVFDRYGQQVYRSQTAIAWDGTTSGKALPTGLYYYVIDVKRGLPVASGWLMLLK